MILYWHWKDNESIAQCRITRFAEFGRTRQRVTDSHVNCDQSKPNHRRGVEPFRSLWSVTQRQDETCDEQADVEVVEDDVKDVDAFEVELISLHRLGQDRECDVEVGLHDVKVRMAREIWMIGTHQREPSKDQVKDLVDHFDVDPELPHE